MNETYGIELELIVGAFNNKINQIKNSFSEIKNQDINIRTNTAQLDYLKSQMDGIKDEIRRIDEGFATGDVLKLEAQLEKLSNQYNKLILKQNELNISSVGATNNMKKGIDKIMSKIKRFGLSLLSIRSIWTLISRASSAYLSQDTALANKLQAVWIGLGSILEPIISAIANTMIRAVAYINVFIKALTGVDLLARATEKSLNKTTKSAKALNKALAGFDELNNLDTTSDVSTSGLDTSWIDAFSDAILNNSVVEMIESFAGKVRELKTAWDELDPSVQNILKLLGLGGLIGIVFGKPGIILGISAIVLGFDGLTKLFDGNLTKSTNGLIELLGSAGLIGILTGNWSVAGAIAGVVLAFYGLNEMINGDTTQAIEGMILLLGGAGLAGVLIGGTKGLSVGLAIASVTILLRGLSDLFSGDATKSVKGFIEIVVGTAGAIIAFELLTGGIAALNIPLLIAVVGFAALASGIALVIQSWGNMNTLERVVSILGLIAIGAAAAAAAVGALQSAWSLGIAAAAIVAGTVAIAAAVSNANKRAQENLPQLAVGTNYVPEDQLAYIHKGEAVIPKKFNSQEYFGGSDDETKSLLQSIINKIDDIDFQPYTTIKDVGKTAVNYINSKNRQLGGSVIN